MELLQPQQTPPDNFQDSRFGLFTASEAHRLMASAKNGDLFGDGAMTYINEKIAECITGEGKPHFNTDATEWGLSEEKDAIMFFEMVTGKKVKHYGMNEYKFLPYKTIGGCSPDGILMDEAAIIQVKCPFLSSNHIPYLTIKGDRQEWLKKKKKDYYTQCQYEMMCADVEKCYFVSYDRRTIEHYHRMAVIELKADVEFQTELAERILQAAVMLQDAIEELKTPDVIYTITAA